MNWAELYVKRQRWIHNKGVEKPLKCIDQGTAPCLVQIIKLKGPSRSQKEGTFSYDKVWRDIAQAALCQREWVVLVLRVLWPLGL